MSHYEVKFRGSKHDKERQALKECVTYLGKSCFNRFAQNCARELYGATSREAYRAVRAALPLIGISGYWPTRAVFKHIWPLV